MKLKRFCLKAYILFFKQIKGIFVSNKYIKLEDEQKILHNFFTDIYYLFT